MKQPTRAALLSIAAFVATIALAALKAGDAAPPFTAPASLAGKPFTYSLKESLAKGPVVVYFYPSAYTSGCNVQAHEFSTKTEPDKMVDILRKSWAKMSPAARDQALALSLGPAELNLVKKALEK